MKSIGLVWLFIPLNSIVPLSNVIKPIIDLIVVVLPAPLGPMNPNISPSFISNETLSTAFLLFSYIFILIKGGESRDVTKSKLPSTS